MTLSRIDILNFKNIEEARLDFSEGVNCLLGSNGMGKSNLLEAIHFVCMARPMSQVAEAGLIRHGEQMMSVNATFADDKVAIGIIRGKGKTLKRNGKEYDRISQHIGRFPIVSVTPSDSVLISGAAQERRRLMDMTLSQADPTYLANLIRYNRSLEQRNNLLRSGASDPILFESVESVMSDAAAVVSAKRREWLQTIAPVATANYRHIADAGEELTLSYSSLLNDAGLQQILDSHRSKDIALGYTSAGVHRDDLTALLDGYSLKNFGSQGQVKTFTIALRLAIYDYLRMSSGQTPILLLDDIFDKLDSKRVGKIMELVSRNNNFGQIFITDTNREHIDETIASLSGPSRLFSVTHGRFEHLDNPHGAL